MVEETGQVGAEIPKAAAEEAECFFWDWMGQNGSDLCEDGFADIEALFRGLHMIGVRHKVIIRDPAEGL
jgi:hypothetical protein